MNCIYKIYLNDDVYVGSTNDYNLRINSHKYSCNNPNSKDYNFPIYQFIRENGGWDTFKKEIINETDKTGKELRELERYYIETLKSNLNSEIPTRNKKEYYENNIDKISEYKKEKIKCDICNSIVSRNNLARHQKTMKCLKNVCLI
jgi:Fic family protein